MKWYFACNTNGLRKVFYQIQGAVLSCKAKTTLQPVALIDDHGIDAPTREKVDWLLRQGVQVIHRRASMLDLLLGQHSEQTMDIYGGHWLRCDIPVIETQEDFVLYTDIDVMFMRDMPHDMPRPDYIACAPEHRREDYSYFNSGVMIINVPNVRKKLPELREVVRSRLETARPYDDQGALNIAFKDQWEHLSSEWNWKPYWGINDDALIVHFHGPKPAHIEHMQVSNDARHGQEYQSMYERDTAAYAHYVKLFRALS